MKPLKQLKRLLLLLCLIVAGVQSAWADDRDVYTYYKTIEVNGLTYYLYTYEYKYHDAYGKWQKYVLPWRIASLCGISGSDNVDIPNKFDYGGYTYYVQYIGYWPDQQMSEDLTFNNITRMSLNATNIYGYCSMPSLTTLVSSSGTYYFVYGDYAYVNTSYYYSYGEICGTLYAPNLVSVEGACLKISGTLYSQALTYLDVPLYVKESGKLDCPNLRTIDCKESMHNFPNNASYSDIFTAPVNTITAHVYDKTQNEINELRNNNVWKGFKEIINHKTVSNYTLTTTGGAELSLLKLNDNVSYVSCNNMSLIAKVTTGSRSGMIKAGDSYAVEIKGVDPNAQIVKLKRNGYIVELGQTTDQGEPVFFYDETNLQKDVNYEVSIEYKTCEVSFTQENYRGNISYSRWLDGETTTGGIYSSQATMTWSRGAKITLSIPYDQYTPQTLKVDGVEKTLSCSNGVATATFYVPSNKSTAQVLLTWQEPQVSYTHHQPQIMIMRSGEGDVLFKGLCAPPDAQSLEAYEHQFGYPAENGVVVSGVADCLNTVTTVTVPDYDFLGRGEGYTFDATEWGMCAEITPVAGQTLKTLLVGWLTKDENGRQMIEWEDMLYGENYGYYLYPEYHYVTYNESTNTYTLNWGFDEMNVWIGDYIINIGMGPEESAIETGKTFNFVRKGGRGQAWIYWHDTDYDFYFNEDGSSSVVIPNEQLTDIQMNVELNEGETMHVYKDGIEITGQFQQRETPNDLWAELEKESASYTLVIEESPDANPTWTILQSGEMSGTQVVITRNGEDEATTLGDAATTMTIDDVGVEKVTLKVPVGITVPMTKYQIRLESIAYGTGTQIVSYLMANCGMSRAQANALVESLPGLIPNQYDSEADAQPIVNGLTEKNAVAVIVPVTAGTQVIANNTPIKVLRNGEDMTFQMTYGDPTYAIYEVPADALTNATWEVSYDTSHRQTIYRKGGTGEVEMAYGYQSNDINVPLAQGFTTVDLPAYNYNAGNTYAEFSIEYVAGEKVKIYRNNEDVTNAFGEPQTLQGKQYYYITDANTGPNTQNAYGFILRDPATWEITVKTLAEQMKTATVANPDGMTISYEYNYVNGNQTGGTFTDNSYPFYFDDTDRTNISSVKLKIPVNDDNNYRPVRVLRNGVDVSYQYEEYDSDDGFLIYNIDLNADVTWNITYETSHRQTVIRKGGTKNWNVEVSYDYPVDGYERYYYPDAIGTPLYVDFPTYHDPYAPYAYISIDVEDGSTFKVLRNGVDVKEKFNPTNGATTGYTRHVLDESGYVDANGSTLASLGFELRDPAVWEITIETDDASQYDLNNDNKVDISDVTKLVNKILEKNPNDN